MCTLLFMFVYPCIYFCLFCLIYDRDWMKIFYDECHINKLIYNKVKVQRSNYTESSNRCDNNIGTKTLQWYLIVYITRVTFSYEDRPENCAQESFSHSKYNWKQTKLIHKIYRFIGYIWINFISPYVNQITSYVVCRPMTHQEIYYQK